MFEKIKQMGNLPIIIGTSVITIVVIILAIFIGTSIHKGKQSNANVDVSDTSNQEENEENDKLVVRVDQEPEEIEKETEKEEEQEKKEENTTTNVDIKYFIRVNYGANVVTIYTKDSKGKYTVPYKVMVCSSGSATPKSGTYEIPSGTYSRGVWGLMFGNVWAQYFTRIKGSILFHSVPYLKRDKSTLEYWEYDKLGTTASAGCIRLTVKDAKWIYNNCPAGTKVEFYSDSNPGPLGKPTAQKISDDEEVRGWDPTDPDSKNPWKTYTSEKKEETTNKNENTTTKPENDQNKNESTVPDKDENKQEETTEPGKEDISKEETTNPGEQPPSQEGIEPKPDGSEGESDSSNSNNDGDKTPGNGDTTENPNTGEDVKEQPTNPGNNSIPSQDAQNGDSEEKSGE